MAEEAAAAGGRYEPGPAFEEVKEEAMLDMSPNDSQEFWLIQWIKDKDLDVSDFHGKNLSLKLHKDGNIGSLESSSGKSYGLVSFAYQQPNATVFLPSGSETKAIGKISRRVCLVRHRGPEELDKPNFGSHIPISKKDAESQRHPKNLLINYAQKKGIQLPLYCPIEKGRSYKSKVVIDGLTFESPRDYCRLKSAEKAAAELALMYLTQEARPQDQSPGSSTLKAAKIAAVKLAPMSLPQEAESQDQSAGSTRKARRKKKRSRAKKEKTSDFIDAPLAEHCSGHEGSALGVGTMSKEQTHEHKEIKDESDMEPSDVSGKVSQGPDVRGALCTTANEMPQTTPERPNKKAKIPEQ